MSDENAVPEVPAETPATGVEPAPVADLPARIAALEPVAQAVLTDALNHVLDGFINHSLVVGMTRLEEMLK